MTCRGVAVPERPGTVRCDAAPGARRGARKPAPAFEKPRPRAPCHGRIFKSYLTVEYCFCTLSVWLLHRRGRSRRLVLLKITALEEYGLRCAIRLAMAPDGQPVTVGDIAEKEGLTVPYVGKLMAVLRQ